MGEIFGKNLQWYLTKQHWDIPEFIEEATMAGITGLTKENLKKMLKKGEEINPKLTTVKLIIRAIQKTDPSISADQLLFNDLSEQKIPNTGSKKNDNKIVINCEQTKSKNLTYIVNKMRQLSNFFLTIKNTLNYIESFRELICTVSSYEARNEIEAKNISSLVRLFCINYWCLIMLYASVNDPSRISAQRKLILKFLENYYLLLNNEENEVIPQNVREYLTHIYPPDDKFTSLIIGEWAITEMTYNWIKDNRPLNRTTKIKHMGLYAIVDIVNFLIREVNTEIEDAQKLKELTEDQVHKTAFIDEFQRSCKLIVDSQLKRFEKE